MAEVIWRGSALDDIERIRLTIAQDSPGRAAEFVNRIFQVSEHLALFPRSGRVVPNLERPDVREIIVRPYRVIYRVDADAVRIYGVRHGAQLLDDIPGL
jgi:plasmid stabilization system protein ParE